MQSIAAVISVRENSSETNGPGAVFPIAAVAEAAMGPEVAEVAEVAGVAMEPEVAPAGPAMSEVSDGQGEGGQPEPAGCA